MDEAKVTGNLGRVGLGKATRLDTISTKTLHLSKDVIMGPTTCLVNRMIAEGRFPASLKEPRVSSVLKKNTQLMYKTIGPSVSYQLHLKYLNVLLKSNLVNILKSTSIHIS